MVTFARRYRVARAGAVGAGLYLCAPVVGPDATSAYNDCALVFFAFMSFYAAMIWWRQRQPGWLILLGIFGGFCFSIKYTGIFAVPMLLAVVGWGTWQRLGDGHKALRRLVLVGLVASFFIVPWLAKTRSPAATRWPRSSTSTSRTPMCRWRGKRDIGSLLAGYSNDPEVRRKNLIAAPLEVTVRGIHFQGLIGPVFLLAPLLLFAWRHPLWRPLMAAAAVAVIPWFSNTGTRFLLPSLVFVSIAMGLTLYRLPRYLSLAAGCFVLAFHGTASWPSVIPKWHPEGLWRLQGAPVGSGPAHRAPKRNTCGDGFRGIEPQSSSRNKATPRRASLSLEPLPEAYFPSRQWVSYQGARNEAVTHVLLTGAGLKHDFWPSRRLTAEWPRPGSQRAAY